MHTELIPAAPQTAAVAPAMEAAKEYIAHSKAENTLKAYRSDWQHFETWCRSRSLPSQADPFCCAVPAVRTV